MARRVVLALLGVFTAIVLLLFQSMFWSPRVSAWMEAAVLAVAVLSYFRPQYGLLALAALVPLGQVGSRTLDSSMRGAEALVLAFLAGALVRGWTLREFRNFPTTRVETAALVFGLIVAASCAEQIWFLQIQRDYAWPFVQSLMTYASRDYISGFRGYGFIFNAMLLLEGTALFLYALKQVHESPGFGRRLVVMLMVGAIAPLALMARAVAADVNPSASSGVFDLLSQRRWSAHIGDVNAAGSFFAMTALIAFGLATKERRSRLLWIAVGLALSGALALTRSRTAIVGMALVSGCVLVAWALGRTIGVMKAVAVAALVLIAAGVAAWQFVPRELMGPWASEAVTVRWLFLLTTWHMALAYPIFGVGVGQFPLWSHQFAPPELFMFYQRENAHNNFAQITGELGMTGIVAFVTLLALAIWPRRGAPSDSTPTIPVLVGLAAFILSWLGGHPLLVPEVAYPFWLALGIVAVGSFATPVSRQVAATAVVTFAILLLSIPVRVQIKARTIDFTQVRHGFSAKQLVTSRGRFYVPAGAERVDVPLRGRSSDDDQEFLIDVLVDDIARETVAVTEREWRTAHVALPPGSSRRFHEIELRVRPPESSDSAVRRRLWVEVGNWEIISKPNG